MSAIALALFASAGSAVCAVPHELAGPIGIEAPAPPDLEALYRAGVEFSEFYDNADRRRELWESNYRDGDVATEMVERARAIEGSWRILAVAEDWCSDSVNTIPFLALLVERVPNLQMRIVDSDAGREVMEMHRTPDDRAATPTVLVLNDDWEAAGCWVERPADLQAWALETRPTLRDEEFFTQKMAWYSEDAGLSTVREIVERLEAAAAGSPVCASPSESSTSGASSE